MKTLQDILSAFMKDLNEKVDDKIFKNILEIMETMEILKKELVSALSGNQLAALRSRVYSVRLSKKMKEFRILTINRKKSLKNLHKK